MPHYLHALVPRSAVASAARGVEGREVSVSAGVLRTVGALPPYSFAALDREPVGV